MDKLPYRNWFLFTIRWLLVIPMLPFCLISWLGELSNKILDPLLHFAWGVDFRARGYTSDGYAWVPPIRKTTN